MAFEILEMLVDRLKIQPRNVFSKLLMDEQSDSVFRVNHYHYFSCYLRKMLNIPVIKEVESIVDLDVFGILRFAITAIPFIPFVLRAGKDANTRNAGIELGFWVSLGYINQALGLLTSDAGQASFISMFTVIIVPLIDGVLGSVVPTRILFGALMSIIGITMLEFSGSRPCVGDLLNFLSAVFFGIHMIRTEHISRRTKRENFLPLLGYKVCTIWYFIGVWFGNGFQESIGVCGSRTRATVEV